MGFDTAENGRRKGLKTGALQKAPMVIPRTRQRFNDESVRVCSALVQAFRRTIGEFPSGHRKISPLNRPLRYHQRRPLDGLLFRIFPRFVIECINAVFATKATFRAFFEIYITILCHFRLLSFFNTSAQFSQNKTAFCNISRMEETSVTISSRAFRCFIFVRAISIFLECLLQTSAPEK